MAASKQSNQATVASRPSLTPMAASKQSNQAMAASKQSNQATVASRQSLIQPHSTAAQPLYHRLRLRMEVAMAAGVERVAAVEADMEAIRTL
jgi:hypothetical protein